MVRLVKPSVRYKYSFIQAFKEFEAAGEDDDMTVFPHTWKSATDTHQGNAPVLNADNLSKHFRKLLAQFTAESRGEHLPKGYVPATMYWLTDGKAWLGRVSIRHKLNLFLRNQGGHIGYAIIPSARGRGYGTTALRLALPKARALRITKALLTVDDDNTHSWKIIENSGGKLQNRIKRGKKWVRRYWITL